MKSIIILITASIIISSCGNLNETKHIAQAELSEDIRINQLGYFPDLMKKFTVADSLATEFKLVSINGKTVFEGELKEYGSWEPSGEFLLTGDFSDYTKEGKYFIYVPGVGKSYFFHINPGFYYDPAREALKSFFFMRASMELDEKYVGEFARPMGHPDDTVYYHPSSGYSTGFISSPGGWYDAGDYGKYVVNAAIATGTMLSLYELRPDIFPDGNLNNGIPEILDEIRYELDWLLTMQDKDGGVFHKLTSLQHDGITMPHETHSKRFIIGKSTAATLDFSALMAQAGRLFSETDSAFSASCLKASVKAWNWAIANPERYFARNPKGVGTGPYNDVILDEEFFWAAAELFCTTGEEIYYKAINSKIGDIQFRLEESWRNYVDNLGYYSLYLSDRLSAEDRKQLEEGIVRLADSLLEKAKNNPYGIPVERFVWGSNSDVLNTAIIQIFAHKVSGDKKYLEAAAMFSDYIFGRNATGYSYVSGTGSKFSKNFHHRLLMADDNEETFKGFIAGGPNYQMQDRESLIKFYDADYPDTIPAKAYIDHEGSYASNEVCINWNAPLVFVLAYLDAVRR